MQNSALLTDGVDCPWWLTDDVAASMIGAYEGGQLQTRDRLVTQAELPNRVGAGVFTPSISKKSSCAEVAEKIEAIMQNALRSACHKNAAVSEFGYKIGAELDIMRADNAETARFATLTRFECSADRLAARADFA